MDCHTLLKGSVVLRYKLTSMKEDNEVLFTTKNLPKDAFVTDSTAWKYSLKDGLTVEDDITTPIDIYDVMPQN